MVANSLGDPSRPEPGNPPLPLPLPLSHHLSHVSPQTHSNTHPTNTPTLQVGPELEVPGYGCEDHFYEEDTVAHSWEAAAALLTSSATRGIVADVGMPVTHRGVRYNCRVFMLDGRVLLIRPKLCLANDGNYREARWFAGWKARRTVEDHPLPPAVQRATGQRSAPFGDAALSFRDAVLAAETCEELFTPDAPHIALALAGVEVFSNGSGSHHQLRKLHTRLDLMRGATAKAGGVYLYANQQGCDGGRLYYDGCACVVVNGELVAQVGAYGFGVKGLGSWAGDGGGGGGGHRFVWGAYGRGFG